MHTMGFPGAQMVKNLPAVQEHVCVLSHFSCVWLFVAPWTVAHQAQSVGFSRQEYWSRLLCPTPGDLPDSKIEPVSLISPVLTDNFFTSSITLEAQETQVQSLGPEYPLEKGIKPTPVFLPGESHGQRSLAC